ncbi:PPOX class F420-dependent oxidoreductase [Antrihabitans sp. YC3-6]|uniref:PPOX class F420-dependent oxidoreductase n=1 Tax=Antrihabitans stalagmiti TaxID=2799499 RepID=A0A934NLW9_9NOCA|nr:PPOX class F420-dependent oxidoreductase [Antrihabitans stalagmiti]MBJ8337648.1 PPOX class F420-dependent oxidoreductase [Antrihabitans stalagmiti]
MPTTPSDAVTVLTETALAFVRERHLATLTTLRADGTPHVVAVGFTWDPEAGKARVITSGGSQKALNAGRGAYGAVSQVDGGRWLTLEGPAVVLTDPDAVADAVARYAVRYRQPRVNPARVVVEIDVRRVLGSSLLR